MENELNHIAKLIAWPLMRPHYQEFMPHIAEAVTMPELHLCLKRFPEMPLVVSPPKGSGSGPAMDWLSEETLRLTNQPVMTPHGRFTVKLGEMSKLLIQLRETCDRIEQYTMDERLNAEVAFRSWLQRSIMSAAHHAEPTPGKVWATGDPVLDAANVANRINNMPLAHEVKEDGLSFPLANLKLEVKPKTPTCIDPFDRCELEGGAEEDTCMILAGESNIGKSHLGLYALSSLAIFSREPTLLCSGEDSEATTNRRIFAHFLRMEDKEMITLTELQMEKMMVDRYGDPEDPSKDYYHLKRNFAITCIDEGKFFPKTIEEKIDAFEQRQQRKVKAFMADYLQKMNENPAGKSLRRQRDEELEFTVNQVKALCQERKCFGLIISQVPSHAAGGSYEFLNLKQAVARSYAATWGAHYVITMNRTAEETKRLLTSADKRPRLNLALAKNKNGPLGVCYALGNPERASWEFFRSKQDLVARTENIPEKSTFDPDKYKKDQANRETGEESRHSAARGLV